jgi:hypothetical protein
VHFHSPKRCRIPVPTVSEADACSFLEKFPVVLLGVITCTSEKAEKIRIDCAAALFYSLEKVSNAGFDLARYTERFRKSDTKYKHVRNPPKGSKSEIRLISS